MNKKMSPVSLTVVEKMKKRTEELKKNQQNLEIDSIIKNDNYFSQIDYSQFNLSLEDENILKFYEKKAYFHGKQIIKNNMELSKIFYEAQKTLSKYGQGSFGKWFETLGFKRTFVYMCLKRNSLFLNYQDPKIFTLPEKVINELGKKNTFSQQELKKIITSPKPLEVINSLFGDRTNTFTQSNKNITISDIQKKIKKLEKQLFELKLLEKTLLETSSTK
ncbi:hypothetical protein [Cetobacterium sp. SF1]|uniref:hypothetical protein n=1 Tax=Cetobacterium sp. SF1 TaxID=3417654 RepID=UPI003CF07C0B